MIQITAGKNVSLSLYQYTRSTIIELAYDRGGDLTATASKIVYMHNIRGIKD